MVAVAVALVAVAVVVAAVAPARAATALLTVAQVRARARARVRVRVSTFFRYENVVASNSFTSSAVSGTMLASRSASASSSCDTQGAGVHSGDQLRASGRPAAARRSALAFTLAYADTPVGIPHALRMGTVRLLPAGACLRGNRPEP